MRTVILALLSVFCLGSESFSQKKQNVYFLKNNGTEVKLKDSADFIRIIQEPDSGSKYFNLVEFYANGVKKKAGVLSKFSPSLVFEGTQVDYYPNGNKKSIALYSKGRQKGLQYYYYQNGKLKESCLIVEVKNAKDKPPYFKKMISYFDSTGLAMIINGTGHYKTSDDDSILIEEGEYLDSLKHGNWTGTFSKSKAVYYETYDRGDFLSGVTRFADGDSVVYVKADEMPKFPGGIEEFIRFVARNFRFPREAMERNAGGRVIVHFVVTQAGKLAELKLENDPGYGIGREALRVVKQSPTWVPGRQHGVPVKVSYTLPIVLNAALKSRK